MVNTVTEMAIGVIRGAKHSAEFRIAQNASGIPVENTVILQCGRTLNNFVN